MKKKIIAAFAGLGLLTAGFIAYKFYKDLDDCLSDYDDDYFDYEDEEPATCTSEDAECQL